MSRSEVYGERQCQEGNMPRFGNEDRASWRPAVAEFRLAIAWARIITAAESD